MANLISRSGGATAGSKLSSSDDTGRLSEEFLKPLGANRVKWRRPGLNNFGKPQFRFCRRNKGQSKGSEGGGVEAMAAILI